MEFVRHMCLQHACHSKSTCPKRKTMRYVIDFYENYHPPPQRHPKALRQTLRNVGVFLALPFLPQRGACEALRFARPSTADPSLLPIESARFGDRLQRPTHGSPAQAKRPLPQPHNTKRVPMPIAFQAPSSTPRQAYSRLSHLAGAVIVGCGIAFHGVAAWASQASLDEVTTLLEQGKTAQAAQQAESHLQHNPGDVQMRFLQGVIAVENKQHSQAITVFTALTRDYPNLPEPYNNLAVLYAAEGQERKASEVLEQAIRANPGYATAHENLGDLYARMASEAYAKALQLDSQRQAIQPKLALITQIFPLQSSPSSTAAPRIATAGAPPSPEALTAASLLARATPAQTPTPTPAANTADTHLLAAVASTPTLAATQGAVDAAPVATKTVATSPQADAANVEAAVKAWASAWADQDMNRYFDAYSENFSPSDGSSLAKWKDTRHLRIAGKPGITVDVQDLKVSIKGDEATARFHQKYAAGSFKSTVRKTLKMQRENGHWRITSEGV